MEQHVQPEGLGSFSQPVQNWFQNTFGKPTLPQEAGWPPIQRGEHTLLLAPTGSGKTLAAFLWGIDRLFREFTPEQGPASHPLGIRLLYISPLKALNNDIERNLRVPLAGIRQAAADLGLGAPDVHVAVRSGDTPPRERRAALRRPPHILITTPESLYLMLTSPRARTLFHTVHTVIVDEIHTLAGNKRGVHLALSLERLQHLAAGRIQRIGLSATIRPLDEVARFLGGAEWVPAQEPDRVDTPTSHLPKADPAPSLDLQPRPVTVVDAGYQKPLDLRIETIVPGFRDLPGGSVWPLLIARLSALIDRHRTTLIFANNRRLAERTADRLNVQRAAEARGEPGGLLQMGVAVGAGFTAAGQGDHDNPIRAHHGSMSREARLQMEQDLKTGRLDALVGTSSLQLGIDIGAVDLVVQLGSPKAVSEGLQRVGRAGHLVGQTSVGRFFALHREDLVEAAAVAGCMLRGEVEATITPHAPLDVLAQQVVAAVATDSWHVEDLFQLVRQAYPYRSLTLPAFQAVLDMLSGRYPAQTHRQLRPRLSWDRVNGVLAALPGSRLQAMSNPGTITDRGAFGAYLPDGKTRIGELDEEFVFETRVGDTFMLGAQVWRVLEITDDRVVVGESPGSTPRMPFWRGDYPWRPYDLGCRVGAFRREVAERLASLRDELGVDTCRGVLDGTELSGLANIRSWLAHDYALDPASVDTILDYVAAQVDKIGTVASDTTIILEVFDDPLGDPRLVVHSSFGGKVNGAWALVLAARLRERIGVQVETQASDDGILLRFHDTDAEGLADVDFPLDLLVGLGPDEARRRLLLELPHSAVFGAQFRQNAARALLLPGLHAGRRTPFWLQRLRARDLLQAVRGFPDFPILLETYRDCLEDVMDLPHLEQVLAALERGEIQAVVAETLTPSPAAQSLMRDFISVYMYEGDAPKADRRFHDLALNLDLLQDLLRDVDLARLLEPEALREVESRLQHTAPRTKARTGDELALILETAGDLSSLEAAGRSMGDSAAWLQELAEAGRIVEVSIPTARGEERRWIPTEYLDTYQAAFTPAMAAPAGPQAAETPADPAAARHILERFLAGSGPVTLSAILARYAFPPAWVSATLDELVASRRLAHGRFTPAADMQKRERRTAAAEAESSVHATAATASAAAMPAVPAPALRAPGIAPAVATPSPAADDEYVDTRVLEQLHRRSLSLLRRQIKSVPHTAYTTFLCEWQHATPATRLESVLGLKRVLEQLRDLHLPAVVWERDVLQARVTSYVPQALDELTSGGGLMWACSRSAASGRARLGFLFRGEGGIFLPPAGEVGTLGADAGRV